MSERETTWDVIVVGAGMAGSACASRLAARDLTCLVIESGPEHAPPPVRRSRRSRIAARLGLAALPPAPSRWPGELELAGRSRIQRIPAILGTGPGGGSLVYGAALTRFRSEDFAPKPRPAGSDEGLPDAWPITPGDIAPWYDLAERTMGVRGERDPQNPEAAGLPALPTAPPGGPQSQALHAAMRDRGLSPFRLPVGMDYRPGCAECLGIVCPRQCKGNAWLRFRTRSGERRPVLAAGATCVRIERLDDARYAVICIRDGATHRHVGRRVVLAAGALNTPTILQRSQGLWREGTVPPMVGAGLMFHQSDLLAVRPPGEKAPGGMVKCIGLHDFYRVGGMALGEVQSLGVVATPAIVVGYLRAEVRRLGLSWLAPAVEFARAPLSLLTGFLARRMMLATIVEDRPYPFNRVVTGDGPHAPLRIDYTVTAELKARSAAMRRLLRERLKGMGLIFLTPRNSLNYGHPMGTCRMGADPATSVVDAMGRVHGQSGIYVCDASTFPSSAGTNPGLTVLANALRIGEAIAEDAVSASIPASV